MALEFCAKWINDVHSTVTSAFIVYILCTIVHNKAYIPQRQSGSACKLIRSRKNWGVRHFCGPFPWRRFHCDPMPACCCCWCCCYWLTCWRCGFFVAECHSDRWHLMRPQRPEMTSSTSPPSLSWSGVDADRGRTIIGVCARLTAS